MRSAIRRLAGNGAKPYVISAWPPSILTSSFWLAQLFREKDAVSAGSGTDPERAGLCHYAGTVLMLHFIVLGIAATVPISHGGGAIVDGQDRLRMKLQSLAPQVSRALTW